LGGYSSTGIIQAYAEVLDEIEEAPCRNCSNIVSPK
jgi:hypothetical protein